MAGQEEEDLQGRINRYYVCFSKSNELNVRESSLQEIFGPNGDVPLTSRAIRAETGLFISFSSAGNGNLSVNERRARSIFINRLKEILSRAADSPYVTNSILRDDPNLISIAYGPSLDFQPTLLSRDIVSLLLQIPIFSAKEDPERYPIVLRLEFFRLLGIRSDLGEPSEESERVLEAVLLSDPSGYVPYYLDAEEFFETRGPDAVVIESQPKSDLLMRYVTGFLNSSGRNSNFLYATQARVPKIVNEKFAKLTHLSPIDYWTPSSRAFALMFLNGTHVRHNGLMYTMGSMSSTASELAFAIDDPTQWYSPCFTGYHLGVIYQDPNAEADDYSVQKQAKFLNGYIETHLTARRCTARPTIMGFVRLLPNVQSLYSLKNPIQFTGATCFASHVRKTTPQNDPTLNVTVYQLGTFVPRVNSPKDSFLYGDSGRDVSAIMSSLSLFMQIVAPELVYSMSAVKINESMHSKLAAVSGSGGLSMPVSVLPDHLKRALLPFTPENKRANRRLIQNMYLNLSSTVCLVAIKEVDLRATLCLMAACKCFACPLQLIAYRAGGHNGVKFFDNRMGIRPLPSVLIKRFSPSFTLPERRSWTDYEQQGEICIPFELMDTREFLLNLLRNPNVGSKEYIVKHMDRCSSGRVARQPGVGPFDLPVSDYSIVAAKATTYKESNSDIWNEDEIPSDYYILEEETQHGHCSSLGERTLLTNISPDHGSRFAILEALLSLTLAPIVNPSDIIVTSSLTWPHTKSYQEELDNVMGVCKEFCSAIGVSFTVSSCSTSSATSSSTDRKSNENVRNIVVTAAAPSRNIAAQITPDLKRYGSMLIHLSSSKNLHHCGSILHQIFDPNTRVPLDINLDPGYILNLMNMIHYLRRSRLLLSAHDVSDGGVWATVCEMAFAGNKSVDITIPADVNPLKFLSSETPGVVVEVDVAQAHEITEQLLRSAVNFFILGKVAPRGQSPPAVRVLQEGRIIFSETLASLLTTWREFSLSQEMLTRPENHPPLREGDYGDNRMALTFEPNIMPSQPSEAHKVCVFLLPGCSIPESLMGALCDSGFNPKITSTIPTNDDPVADIDVMGICIIGHSNISDGAAGDKIMAEYTRAIPNIATSIRRASSQYDVWTLAIGHTACEVLFGNKVLGYNRPGNSYVRCKANLSGRFESRWLNVHIPANTRAIALQSLRNCTLPCWAQGTHLGFEHESGDAIFQKMEEHGMVASRFYGRRPNDGPATQYPRNPTEGSSVSGICSADGRHLALLHDPSLCFNLFQWQCLPSNFKDLKASPWKRMFYDLHSWSIEIRRDTEPPIGRVRDPVRNEALL